MDHAHQHESQNRPEDQPGSVTAPPFWRSRYAVLILLGFLLQWPTLLTLLMFPILLLMYGRLAITEEADMRKQFGAEYEAWAAHTPRFIPSFGTRSSPT